MICNDEPCFLPSNFDNLVFDIYDDRDKILQIIDLIYNTYINNFENITNNLIKDSQKLFSALNGAYLLGRNKGGKIIIFSSSNTLNQNPKMKEGIDKNWTKEQMAYSCHDKRQLGNMGINLTNENISCDIFVTAETQINTFTLNQLCEYTNGNLYFYKNFNIDIHYKNIFNQIRRVLSRPIAWEAVNRVRFSNNYKINTFVTPVLITNSDLLIFPCGDSDQNYEVGLTIKNNVNNEGEIISSMNKNIDNKFLYIQSALLYSYGDGTRRIRIHNLCLPLSNNIRDIYNSINIDALVRYSVKETIDKIYKTKNISNSIISTDSKFKHIIEEYFMCEQKMKKELNENLSLLPYYFLGMFKHRIFCKDEIDKNYDIDLSNFLRIKIQKMNSTEILSFLYPNIYSIHELYENNTLGTYNENGEIQLPSIINCNRNQLLQNGLYLIDNGYLLIIYCKKLVDKNILKLLFNIEDLEFLTIALNEDSVFQDNNEFKERIMNIIDYIRGNKSLYQNLIFVIEDSKGEKLMNDILIEDNNCNWFPMSFDNFYKKYISGSNIGGYGY